MRVAVYGKIPRLDLVPKSTFNLLPEDARRFWSDHIKGIRSAIHRALSEADNASKIAVVGGGRCYDIDLNSLIKSPNLKEISIVDLNEAEVHGAASRVKDKSEKLEFVQMDITLIMADFIEALKIFPEVLPTDTQDPLAALIVPFIELFKKCCEKRKFPEELEKKYDVVVSDAILSQLVTAFATYVYDYIESKSLLTIHDIPVSKEAELRKQLMFKAYEMLIPDHIKMLRAMTRESGRIVLVAENSISEHAMLPRGGKNNQPGWVFERKFEGKDILRNMVIEPVLRDGENIDDAVKRLVPDLPVISSQKWRWNRVPPELHEAEITNAHEVMGITLVV